MAFSPRVVAIAAGAGVEGRDQHKICRKRRGIQRAADGDVAVFERLAEDFERRAVEFGELVEKQHAVVGEADFSGRGC